MKLAVILTATRDVRFGVKVAPWVLKTAKAQGGFNEVDLIDVKEFNLPLYNEVAGPKYIGGQYKAEGGKAFAAKIAEADAFLLIHSEHNHGVPAETVNALDYAYDEWNKKAIGFVGYGGAVGGSRATEQLRGIAAELQLTDIQLATHLIGAPFGNWDEDAPLDASATEALTAQVEQLAWYAHALKVAREAELVAA